MIEAGNEKKTTDNTTDTPTCAKHVCAGVACKMAPLLKLQDTHTHT